MLPTANTVSTANPIHAADPTAVVPQGVDGAEPPMRDNPALQIPVRPKEGEKPSVEAQVYAHVTRGEVETGVLPANPAWPNTAITVVKGRFSPQTVLQSYASQPAARTAVFVCGPTTLIKLVRSAVRAANKTQQNHFDFHEEIFHF